MCFLMLGALVRSHEIVGISGLVFVSEHEFLVEIFTAIWLSL